VLRPQILDGLLLVRSTATANENLFFDGIDTRNVHRRAISNTVVPITGACPITRISARAADKR